MRRIRSQEGSVAVFLCIIIVSLFIFAGVLTDVAGIHTAEIQIQRALDIAARSVLSEYDRNLKNEYGLFGTCQSEAEMEEKIEAYTNRMLNPELNMPSIENASELYDFRIENIFVETDGRSLNNLIIFEDQVLEFMKYRAPLGRIYEFSKEVESVNKASNSLELINKATDVFKELANFEAYLNHLRKYSDGWYCEEGKKFTVYGPFIKSIAVQGSDKYIDSVYPLLAADEKKELACLVYSKKQLGVMWKEYLRDIDLYIECRCKIKCMEELQEGIKTAKKNSEDEEKAVDYDWFLKSIAAEIKKCKNTIKIIKLHKYYDFFNERKDSCNKALSLIRKAIVSLKNTERLVNEVEAFMSQYDGCILEPIKATMANDIKSIRNLMGSQAESVLTHTKNIIESNGEAIEEQMQCFDEEAVIEQLEGKASRLGKHWESGFKQNMRDVISEEIEKLLEQDTKYHLLKERYKKAFNTFMTRYNSEYSIEPFSPSQIKHLTESDVSGEINISDFTDRDAQERNLKKGRELRNQYIIERLPSYLYGTTDGASGMSHTIVNILGRLKGNVLKGECLRDNLYVNEYILNFFKNHITSAGKNESFFEHEAEYVLYGDLRDENNFSRFKNHLLLLRSGLNLVHIYSDPLKKAQVLEAAAALSGGTGTFLLQFIIASAWAEAEAEEDISRLIEGENVAFIKSKDDWVLSFENFLFNKGKKHDVNIQKKTGSDIDFQPNSFSYEDYLRIFFLMHNKEIKFYRILDLIQINMKGRHYKEFETKNFSGSLKVKAEVSIKCRFLTVQWMPEFIRYSSASRKSIKAEVQHSY